MGPPKSLPPPSAPPSPLPAPATQHFELYTRSAREGLQAFLIRVLERCQQGFSVVHSAGVPRTAITNKLRFYQEAAAHPERAAKLSTQQLQAIRLQRASAGGGAPGASGIRRRTVHARDAFGPGMVIIVNAVLTWLMFSIDVRNSMLK